MIALLGVVPLWRILPARATGLAGAATADAAASYSAMIWYGVVLALIPGILAAMFVDGTKLERAFARMAEPLTRPRVGWYALTLAFVATALAAFVAMVIMDGRATLIDSFAQLTQARYMAAGRLAGPVIAGQESWYLPQTLITANGWVSQYPPGYIALLAVGFTLGIVPLIGPLMFGIAVFFTALIAEEVFDNRALARVAALLAAISPFMLGQAGAYMSHVPAAAFCAGALYFVLRGVRGNLGCALAAGVCIGALLSIRPLTGAVAAATALVYVLFDRRPWKTRLLQIALAVLGAAPFALLIAVYNAHFFGSATTFGYDAALGPAAGLGFGKDPWGNAYGLTEALAYTSAELAALSVHLLETPLPLVALVGVYFVVTASVRAQARLLFWWVSSLVIAYLFYWHHGLFMGPRMLADMGTLWVLLAVFAVAGLIARVPADWHLAGKYNGRSLAAGAVTTALILGVVLLTPARLFSYTPPSDVHALLRAPVVQTPSLIFVHGGWTSRIGARLAAHGMRLDSIETALRQNGTCAVHNFSLDYAAGVKPRLILDFAPRAINLPPSVQVSPGNRIRMQPGERVDAGCRTEIAADTAGVVDVAPYIWQGDLPGLNGNQGMFVRDMGPAANARLIAQHRHRSALMLTERNGNVQLIPYEAGMRARWGAN